MEGYRVDLGNCYVVHRKTVIIFVDREKVGMMLPVADSFAS